LPPTLVAAAFLVAVLSALALMVYITWRGSKPSAFFREAVRTTYELQLQESDINGYYELKDRLHGQAEAEPEALLHTPFEAGASADGVPWAGAWVSKLAPEDKISLQKALMRRLVSGIERLNQVQKDKPGNWKLWRGKLISERYWGSFCEAEALVDEEISSCLEEAEELEPGWREHIFPNAVQIWRMQKQRDVEKKVQKKAVEQQKKQKEKEVRKKEVDARLEVEEKLRQERLAEKMMEKLLREEENDAKCKAKGKAAAAKPKPKAKRK